MGNTPKGLFEAIKAKHTHPTFICEIHKPCRDTKLCQNVSVKEVLDFDAIKREEDKEHGISDTRKSVDAVTYSDRDTYFCFVEFKGWSEFLSWHGDASLDDFNKQIEDYGLERKLTDSIEICKGIVGENVFKGVNVCFIVVTDIDINTNSVGAIAKSLTYLAVSSSNSPDICNALLKGKLDDINVAGMDGIKKLYLFCQEFDSQMSVL